MAIIMKILIFSDSHRNIEPMVYAVTEERPDAVIHLGDLESDAEELRNRFPALTIYGVSGNCDFMPLSPRRILLKLAGKTVFAAHGHTYGVKSGYAAIINTAMTAGADILLFGHTHQAMEKELPELLVINPGSIGMGARTYGVLTMENGDVSYEKKSSVY